MSILKSNKLSTREILYVIRVENEEIILKKENITCINPPICPKISINLV